jgi:hypothetical protein
LHEAYLQQLAVETGLGYLRVDGPGELLAALHANHGSTSTRTAGDARWLLAGTALLALLASHLGWRLPPELGSRLARGALRLRQRPRRAV